MSFIGYLRLVRFPNVVTAATDIIAGAALVRSSATRLGPATWDGVPQLLGASAALYLAGMAFNDISDRADDAVHRPNRPIPSGQVSLRGAMICGFGLMVLGLALAASVSGDALLRAGVLAFAVLQYNFTAKHNVLMGPLVLGFCRFLNVQLAMTSHPDFSFLRQTSTFFNVVWVAPFVVGIYAAGLTAFSAQEESGRKDRAILLGWVFCGGAILLAGLHSSPASWAALAPLALLLQFLTFKLRREGTPGAARNLVRFGVMGVAVLDAGLILGYCGWSAWPLALLCIGLLVPGVLIAKALAQKEA